MKTPEQLKGAIRSMTAKKNLRAQEVLQMLDVTTGDVIIPSAIQYDLHTLIQKVGRRCCYA